MVMQSDSVLGVGGVGDGGGGVEVDPVCVLVYFCAALLSGFTALCTVRTGARGGAHSDSRLLLPGCFSSGVFLALDLLDVVPSYVSEMRSTFSELGFTLRFPVSEFLLAVGFLLLLVMEQVIISLREDGERGEEHKVLLSPSTPSLLAPPHPEPWLWSVRSFVLLFCLCSFSTSHALSPDAPRLRPHQLLLVGLVSAGLVLTLTQNRMRRPIVSACLLLQSGSFPLGLALRRALLRSGASLRLARATVRGLSVGGFSYVLFLDLIPRVMTGNENRIVRVTLILTGFTAVTTAILMKA